jgi:hypothetical protein
MNSELERIWKEMIWHNSRNYSRICLEGMTTTIETSVRIVDAPAKLQAGHHPNANVTTSASLLDTASLAIEGANGILTWSF